ncbi:hypothetical protein SAY87_016745 [Trapa incisa]|uniref:Uncharacterized protein n=1 Tax=Trapa incisa TaxID=236973 RepID=A0AAN7L9T6_9MYRT|nr:hypothetical protein SAY87_016745 [Trapa incisa]
MGRGRGKAKKISASNHDDTIQEENIPTQKRRGRPQKLLKEAFDEEEIEMVEEEEDGEDAKSGITTKEPKSPVAAENGNKRKRNTQMKDKASSTKEEAGAGGETRTSIDDSSRPNGYRHSGSRRKNKPHRAAGVGVRCL